MYGLKLLILSPNSTVQQLKFENGWLTSPNAGDGFFNIFSINIHSSPKHGDELVNFISSMETKFDVIILTEIGARNSSVVLNLFPNYTFHYVRPHENNYGGVGIYTHHSLLNVVMIDDLMLTKTCDCVQNVNLKASLLNLCTMEFR